MQITFWPAIGVTTSISLPSPSSIHFTATFPVVSQLELLQKNGARLQLWSDLPVAGTSPGEWGPMDFATSNNNPGVLSLDTAQLDLPPAGSPLEYHFTYRLVHSSGEIQWLGAFGDNGRLMIQRHIDAVELVGEWDANKEPGHISRNVEGSDIELLKIPPSWNILPASPSPFLFLVPPCVEHVAPTTTMLSSSKGLPFLVDSSRAVKVSGSLVVNLQPLDSASLSSLISDPQFPTLALDNYAIVRGSHTMTAIPIKVLPALKTSISLDQKLFPDEELILWSSEAELAFHHTSQAPFQTLQVPQFGAVFEIHRPYQLKDSKLFLSSTVSISASDHANPSLPTPPPSPRLDSRRLSSAEAQRMEQSTNQQDTSQDVVILPRQNGGLSGIMKRFLIALLSLFSLFLAPRSKRRQEDSQPTENTPLLAEVESSTDSGKTSVLVLAPSSRLDILLFPKGSSQGLSSEVEGQAVKPTEVTSLDVHGLGEVDVLTYDISTRALIKFTHS